MAVRRVVVLVVVVVTMEDGMVAANLVQEAQKVVGSMETAEATWQQPHGTRASLGAASKQSMHLPPYRIAAHPSDN